MRQPAPRPVCAFEELFVPLRADALRFARRLTRDAVESEDVVQEAYLRARTHFARFNRALDPRPWLLAIVYNEFASRRRAEARRPVLPLGEVAGAAEPDDPHPADHLTPEILQRALLELPPAQREAVRLRDLQGCSYRQLAEAFGVPLGTVMSRLHRGRARLRILLGALPGLPGRRE